MKKQLAIKAICLHVVLLTFLLGSGSVWANISFMDDKLVIDGYLRETAFIRTDMYDREKPFHDSRLDYLMTTALFETLYKLKDEPDLSVNLFGGFKAWWQKAMYFDTELRHSIPHRDRQDYVFPRSFEDDVLTEAYADIISGPLQVRAGKQIVCWGSLPLERVADVVNPIDLRRGFPGLNSWEDIKQGLWMLRAIYQSDLPGTLLFEGIFNPGDFKNAQLMYEGADPGPLPVDTRFFSPQHQLFGIYHWEREKWNRDAPGWDLEKNYEFGGRVRGNTYDVDWTLLLWNARDDGPVANARQLTKFTLPFIVYGIKTAIVDHDITPPNWPGYKVFDYKRYTTIGGTAQTFLPSLWNTVWKTEWFVELNRPLNTGKQGSFTNTSGSTRRNIVNVAIDVYKALEIPYFTRSTIACNAMLETNLTFGFEKTLNHNNDLVLTSRNYYWKDSSMEVFNILMRQPLFHQKLMFVFTGNYYVKIQKWMAIPSITYVFPGKNWRADVMYVAYGGANKEWVKSNGSVSSQDNIVLRLRYEF